MRRWACVAVLIAWPCELAPAQGRVWNVASQGTYLPVDPNTRAAERGPSHARDLVRWREMLDVGLYGPLLTEIELLVAPRARLETDGETVALVARALFASGEEARAEKLLERAVDTERGRVALILTSARFAIERDELAKAVDLVARKEAGTTSAVEGMRRESLDFMQYPEAGLVLGRALFRLGRHSQAEMGLEYFADQMPNDPEVPSALYMLAQICIERRDPARQDLEEAASYRRRAEAASQWHGFFKARKLQMREHPEDPLPRLGVAELWIAANDLDRARTELGELVALFPKFARGWSLLGDVQRARKEPAQAVVAYAKALELEPALPDALLGRARCAMDDLRWSDAKKDLDALVAGPRASEPRLSIAHLELARVCAKLGDAAAAAKHEARYRELGGTEPLEKR